MKVIPQLTYSAKDLRQHLELGDGSGSVVWQLPQGFVVRKQRTGQGLYSLFVYDLDADDQDQAIGVAVVAKEKLPTTTVTGVSIIQAGLRKEYRGLGYLWRIISAMANREVVIAPAAVTPAGKAMWLKRIRLDHHHAYLAFNPKGFGTDKQWLPLTGKTLAERLPQLFDGSLQTRLVCTALKSQLLHRYNISLKS